MTERARYVERDNEIIYPPPYEQADTFLTAWLVPSPKERQREVVDAHLNAVCGGSPFEYRPLLDHGMLVLANIGKVTSLDGRAADLGFIPEVDICVWLLCGAYRRAEDGSRVLDHIAWYVPYIWVTTADTMATGREVFGYPKAIGWAQLPEDPHDPGPLWADGLVIPEFGPRSEVVRRRLFDLKRAAGTAGGPTPAGDATSQGEALSAIARRVVAQCLRGCEALPFIESCIDDLAHGHVPMVFLKQFRSVSDSTSACYQAIVEANATVNGFAGAGFLPPGWDLRMYSYASVDIPKHLGIAPEQRIDLGFYVRFSFSMDLGKEVWRAGGAP